MRTERLPSHDETLSSTRAPNHRAVPVSRIGLGGRSVLVALVFAFAFLSTASEPQQVAVQAQTATHRLYLPYARAASSASPKIDMSHLAGHAWGVATRGSSLYVGHGYALSRIDLDAPSAPPVTIHRFQTSGSTSFEIDGRLLVRNGGNHLLFDIDRAGSERLLWNVSAGEIDRPGFGLITSNCRVSRARVLICWQSGEVLKALSIDDSGIRDLGSLAPNPENGHSRWMTSVDSTKIIMGICCEEDSGGSAGFEIIDITDPRAMRSVSILPYDNSLGLTQMQTIGSRLYAAAHYSAGRESRDFLAVYDLDVPKAPRLISTIEDFGSVEQFLRSDNILYALGRNGELSVIDINDPSAPRLTARVPACGSPASGYRRMLGRTGKHLFIACGDSTLAVFDVSNRSEPRSVTTWSGAIAEATLNGSTIVVRTDSDVRAINVGDVTAPHVTRTFRTYSPIEVTPAGNDRLWILDESGTSIELVQLRAMKEGSAAVSSFSIGAPVATHDRWADRLLSLDGGVAHLSGDGLGLYDDVDGEIVRRAFVRADTPWEFADVEIADGTLWVLLAKARQLVAYDIRDRGAPTLLGEFALYGPLINADSLAIGHGRIYVGTPGHGTSVFAINDLGRVSGPMEEWPDMIGVPVVHGEHLILLNERWLEVVDPSVASAPERVYRVKHKYPYGHPADGSDCRSHYSRSHSLVRDTLLVHCFEQVAAFDLTPAAAPEPAGVLWVAFGSGGRLMSDGQTAWLATRGRTIPYQGRYSGLYRFDVR